MVIWLKVMHAKVIMFRAYKGYLGYECMLKDL